MKKQFLTLFTICAFAASAFAQVPSYVPSNGLVAWYPFSGNANDESSYANNGTVNGATLTADRFGNPNEAYSFDGVNDYIALNNSSIIFGTNPQEWSINLWFNFNTFNGVSHTILSDYNGPSSADEQFSTLIEVQQSDSYVYTATRFSAGQQTNLVDSIPQPTGNWEMLTAVYSKTSDSLYLYRNDLKIDAKWLDPSLNYFNDASSPLYIGRRVAWINGEYFFNGNIDDIGFWDRALTEQEIITLYTGCANPITATITPNGNTTFCAGGFVQLTASAGNSYVWSNGETTQSITPTQAGPYTVTVSNNDGCSDTSDPLTVTVNPVPSAAVNASGSTTFCSGNSVTLTAQGSGTYLWSNGETTQSIAVSATDSYSVTVTSNSCSATSAPIAVTVNPTPTVTITANGSATFCDGGFVQLSASSGGSYQWNTGAQTQSINATQGGSYTVIVMDNGCSDSSDPFSVTVNPNPTVTLSPYTDICSNSNAVTLGDGSPASGSYTLNASPATELDPSVTGTGQQTIGYSYTDQNGCSGSATQTVNVLAAPTVTLSGLNASYLLSDNPATLTGTPLGGVFSGNGVANGMFDPAVAGLGTHSAVYSYYDGNTGCMGAEGLCTTVDLNVGIDGTNQIATGGGIEIYPNPSSGLYSLSFEIEGVVTYSVFDSRGRELVNERFVSNGSAIKTLDLSDYSSGIYAIQIGTTDGFSSYKLIKE